VEQTEDVNQVSHVESGKQLKIVHWTSVVPGAYLKEDGQYMEKRCDDRVWAGVNKAGDFMAVESDGVSTARGCVMAQALIDTTQTCPISVSGGNGDKVLIEIIKTAREYARKQSPDRETVATFTAIVIAGRRICWAHLGDSRLYILSQNQLSQVTTDHDALEKRVWQLIREGHSRQRAVQVARKEGARVNVLTRGVGLKDFFNPETGFYMPLFGDVLLLVSDGVTKYISDEEIKNVIKQALEQPDPAAFITNLARTEAEKTGRKRIDDISAVMVKIEEGTLQENQE